MSPFTDSMLPSGDIARTQLEASEIIGDVDVVRIDETLDARQANEEAERSQWISLRQLYERDPERVHRMAVFMQGLLAAESAHVFGIGLQMKAGEKVSGSLRTATNEGIKKQAISKDELVGLSKMRRAGFGLYADAIAKGREVSSEQRTGEKIAPKFKTVGIALPVSYRGEHPFDHEVQVEVERDGKIEIETVVNRVSAKIHMRVSDGKPIAKLQDGTEVYGPFSCVIEQDSRGNPNPNAKPFVRVWRKGDKDTNYNACAAGDDDDAKERAERGDISL